MPFLPVKTVQNHPFYKIITHDGAEVLPDVTTIKLTIEEYRKYRMAMKAFIEVQQMLNLKLMIARGDA